ncbi:MAG: citrate lyase acyl carrier protein, partial [Planctomycetes bacterium]|nr:citrate lyase acyl carrier protein [Planctomycetota bacterium]
MSNPKTGNAKSAEAGRRGSDVRSDCWVKIEPTADGGIDLNLKSKVESMYGDATRTLVREVLAGLGVEKARVEIEDAGALPFVIAARVEAAARRLGLDVGEGYTLDVANGTQYDTQRDRFRRSRLYLPGNDPKFMLNAGLHRPDAVILDLEDSVAPPEKDAARILVRNALRALNFYGAERMVRINQGDRGLEDLEFIVPHNVHLVLIPKVEGPDQVRQVDERIREFLSRAAGFSPRGAPAREASENTVFLMPIIESALGAIKSYEIATASDNNVALAIGLEDYTADISAQRTPKGRESSWARSQVV